MLPGKKYTPEDFLRIAWTRKWFIVIPAIVVGSAVFAWSQTLPDRYRASTTILVVPQRVPESFVRSTVTADVSERLQTISQQILSRTRLERIIDEFNLYEEERQTMIMEDVVERMRRNDISVNIAAPRRRGADASSFTVSFESRQPRAAMQVAERLASLFVQENLQDREVLADSTSQFLQAQLEEARRRLVEHETKLEEFRRQHAGRLPSQMESNLQMLQTTQAQLQANAEAANRERDRLLTLEAATAEIRSTADRATPLSSDESAATAAQHLEAARAELRRLELRLKAEHPDIVRAKRVIAELEALLEARARNEVIATAGPPDAAPVAPLGLSAAAANRLTAMRLEAQEIRARLDTRKAEEERLQQVLAAYTSRLEAAPSLQSEQTELMRDYETLREQYTALLRKTEESKIALNLERRQIGEQFRVIDGARLPERPISPDRTRLNLMGFGAGLGLGLALVVLLEYRDTTLKTDVDVLTSLSLPVLAVIPAMITTGERQRIRRRRLRIAMSASVASLLIVAALVAWRFDLLLGWVP